MSDPVAWDLAEKVALRISGREPFSESYHSQSLEPDFIEATATKFGIPGVAVGGWTVTRPSH